MLASVWRREHKVVMDGTSAGPGPASGKGAILLVEDDVTFGEAVGRILRGAGFDVTVAADFRVALEVLEAERPIDLLISDIVMPSSVNGIALSRMARLRRRDLKIMYLTGYNIPGIENEALGPILRKPIDDAVLVSEVERMMATV
ncbi:MAG TPA: response regulator [Acetobacteraceae bacterium]|jgi:CheY-like chemotaxis protein|nr:response regulator [Acetobacteraceae bacterium]